MQLALLWNWFRRLSFIYIIYIFGVTCGAHNVYNSGPFLLSIGLCSIGGSLKLGLLGPLGLWLAHGVYWAHGYLLGGWFGVFYAKPWTICICGLLSHLGCSVVISFVALFWTSFI